MNPRFSVKTPKAYDEALAAMKAALKAEGFGILTEVDVKAALSGEPSLAVPRYDILGAYNTGLVREALEADLDSGPLLPCNVIVYESDSGGSVVVALDPEAMMSFTGNAALEDTGAKAMARLQRAIASVLKPVAPVPQAPTDLTG